MRVRDQAREGGLLKWLCAVFESPFYVDFPIGIAGACLVVAAGMLMTFILVCRGGTFAELAVASFWRGKHPGVPAETKRKVAAATFLFLACLCGVMGLFSLAVATGIIKNKETPSVTPEQVQKLRQEFERKRGIQ
jgi:hypothetical protein